jgi:glycosyltransferase involved in cell wall biosynthesis
MEAGIPVLATVTSQPMSELVANADGAIVAVPPSAEAFAATIGALASDPAERRRLGELGRAAVCERYSLDSAIARWRDIWAPTRSAG